LKGRRQGEYSKIGLQRLLEERRRRRGRRCEEEEEEEEEEEGLFKADAVREYRYGSMQERERREVTSAPGRIVPGANGKRSAKLPSVIVKSQLRNPRQTNLNPQSSRLSLAYTIAY